MGRTLRILAILLAGLALLTWVESAVERALQRIPTAKLNSARQVLRALAESLVDASARVPSRSSSFRPVAGK